MYKIQSLLAVVFKSFLCVNIINFLYLKVTFQSCQQNFDFTFLSDITLETSWILKVNMFHVNSMILEVKRSLTVFLLIHLKVIYII